ncbi:Serine/threonineprotein kinase [Pelomyxa schiedti]|nr:Serine/threonineprotein kinase [Pelomyxa schiedti]
MSDGTVKGLRQGTVSSDDPDLLFTVQDVIGKGSFGVVCACRSVGGALGAKIYAVKFIALGCDGTANSMLQKEVDALREIEGCPHCVQYHGCYMKETTLMIVMEYCDLGSLVDIMSTCPTLVLTEDIIAAIISRVLQGLLFLHSKRIVHRDVSLHIITSRYLTTYRLETFY